MEDRQVRVEDNAPFTDICFERREKDEVVAAEGRVGLSGPGRLRVHLEASPVARVASAPLPDVVHVRLAFEVVQILGAPKTVATVFSGLTAGGPVTVALACAVAQIRKEWMVAVAADFLVF
jgi:hypothetical protein